MLVVRASCDRRHYDPCKLLDSYWIKQETSASYYFSLILFSRYCTDTVPCCPQALSRELQRYSLYCFADCKTRVLRRVSFLDPSTIRFILPLPPQAFAPAVSRFTPTRTYAQVSSNWINQKVTMSNLEKDKFINYQRIEDNLAVVKKRYAGSESLKWRVMARIKFKSFKANHPCRTSPARGKPAVKTA